MIVKLDFEKVYERVDWRFLVKAFEAIGVGECLKKVIMSCINSTKLFVIWNGEQLEGFKPERAYLIVICMEVLGRAINKATSYED